MKKTYALLLLISIAIFLVDSLVSCQKSSNTKTQSSPDSTVVSNPVITSTSTSIGQSPPKISYSYPAFFTANKPIKSMIPSNTGTTVPTTIYTQVSTYAGNQTYQDVDGPALSASFTSPTGLCFDEAGNLFVTELGNAVRKINPKGNVSTLVTLKIYYGGSVGPITDLAGNVYFSDQYYNEIKKMTPTGVVSVIAGTYDTSLPYNGAGSVDGIGTAASFNRPEGIAIDRSGNLYVADYNNGLIRKVAPDATVTTIASGLSSPNGIAIDQNDNLFVSEVGSNNISKITPSGVVSKFAGNSTAGYKDNGPGSDASFNDPEGLVCDATGNLYVVDHSNGLIRKITPDGIVVTLAGNGVSNYISIDGVGTKAEIEGPEGITLDQAGSIYITDGDNLIRKMVNTGYSVAPALPDGLTFDSATGTISGTPTVSGVGDYTITAHIANGATSSTTIELTVK